MIFYVQKLLHKILAASCEKNVKSIWLYNLSAENNALNQIESKQTDLLTLKRMKGERYNLIRAL